MTRGALLLRAGVLAYLALLVGIPLTALAASGISAGGQVFWEIVISDATIHALRLSLWTAVLMAAVNAVMGTATAWVLVRYRFPGRALLAAVIDLPFAIPTLVAGLMLVILFGPQEPLGAALDQRGFPVAFATPGILLALLFVTLPIVVRAVEPVLRSLDPAEEEASSTLGAGRVVTFRRVVLPALLPAVTLGALQSFSRALAEFGSIVVISGNIPYRTLTAPVLVHAEVEAGRPQAAAAVSLLLLVAALAATFAVRRVAHHPEVTGA